MAVKPKSVVGVNGGLIVHGKTGGPPRQKKLDTLLGDEVPVTPIEREARLSGARLSPGFSLLAGVPDPRDAVLSERHWRESIQTRHHV